MDSKRIPAESAPGKTVSNIYNTDETLIIVFDDDTYCYYACEYADYYDDSKSIHQSVSNPKDHDLYGAGLISRKEFDKRLEKKTEQYNRDKEKGDRELYEELKRRFEKQ